MIINFGPPSTVRVESLPAFIWKRGAPPPEESACAKRDMVPESKGEQRVQRGGWGMARARVAKVLLMEVRITRW